MIHFTRYAENKFEILNKHKIFFTREQIVDTVATPDKITKKGSYLAARKENIKVVYKKQGDIIKIVAFYPIK